MYDIVKIGGLTFLFSPFKGLETASLGVFLRIGSRYEKANLKGIAHFLEHILFKGSKNYSYTRIKREIEGRGGSLNGFTSQELTAYYAHFLNKNLRPTLDILMDMIFHPLLKIEDIERERNVILEEIKMYNDLPSSRSVALLEKLLWRDHPLGEDVIGNFSTVKRIKKRELASFKESYYLPYNCVVSCSGDFDKDRIVKLLRKKVREISRKSRLVSSPPLPLRSLHVDTEKKELHQSHLCLGFRSVSYFSKERFVADLINVILGANMSSRLFEEIREKRALCYDISTEARKYKDSGAFIIHLGTDKDKIEVALKAVLRELGRIKNNYVSRGELERAKDFFLGQIIMGMERPQGRMFYLAESYLNLGRIYTLDEIVKEVRKINPSMIKRLANRIFRRHNMCVSCVGDIESDTKKKIKDIVKKVNL
jgi:predicted Zn-dependent peptidase